MNTIILIFVPLFALLIIVEVVVDRLRGTGYYRMSDSINSVSAGILSRLTRPARKFISLAVYAVVVEHVALFDWQVSTTQWIVAFILYDFCYYWKHRTAHEVNILWAAHVVHHSSEEFNLSTALRQPSGNFIGWIFYLPMALLGIDVMVMLAVGTLNLVYQFWVHTRYVPKLGWCEWLFVTPSNHRVHHAINDVYIDRNYGGVFIIWDRLFKSYQEESPGEPCMYGIRKPLHSWNPIWTNVHVYCQLISDARRAQSWSDKLKIWFMPTGWRPGDVAQRYPIPAFELSKFRKFDVEIRRVNAIYAQLQHIAIVSLALLLIANLQVLSIFQQCLLTGFIVLSLYGIGAVLEAKPFVVGFEIVRQLMLPVLVWYSAIGEPFLTGAVAVAAVGIMAALWLKKPSTAQTAMA